MLIGRGEIESVRGAQTAQGRVVWNGSFFYRDEAEGEDSAARFLADFAQHRVDFNQVFGAYHMALETAEQTAFFADGGGVCRFFVDEGAGLASDSFLALLDARGGFRVDGRSAEEFLALGYVYGGRTLDRDVVRSDPGKYYVLEEGRIRAVDKGLSDLARMKGMDLDGYMEKILPALSGKKLACVITGGVDSRMVLANLVGRGVECDLAVSGSEASADVRIAREIAARLQKRLFVFDGEIRDEEDFQEALLDSDGQRDCVSRYRLTRMWRFLEENGYDACFGGVTGELYKNSYLNQDFPFYFGKPNIDKFMRMKVVTSRLPQSLRGGALPGDMAPEVRAVLEERGGAKKGQAYFRAGLQVMQDRYTGTNNRRGRTAGISPLAEPAVEADAFVRSPWSLELHRYSRRQVTRRAPQIAAIPTERGLTCQSGFWAETADFFKNYYKLAKYGVRRALGRNLKPEIARGNPLLTAKLCAAVNACAQAGIFRPGAGQDSVPAASRGAAITLGALLERYGQAEKR